MKAELLHVVRVYTKSRKEKLHLNVKPIAIILMQLIKDDNFSVGRLKALHESTVPPSESASHGISDMPKNAPVPSPLASGEQNTPLTSKISDKSKVASTPQQQNQLSSLNLEVKLSPNLLPLQASPKLDPVDLEDNFAAATEAVPGNEQKFDSPSSPENKVTVYELSSYIPKVNIFRGLETQSTGI